MNVDRNKVNEDAIDAMWAFLRIGGQKANIQALPKNRRTLVKSILGNGILTRVQNTKGTAAIIPADFRLSRKPAQLAMAISEKSAPSDI